MRIFYVLHQIFWVIVMTIFALIALFYSAVFIALVVD